MLRWGQVELTFSLAFFFLTFTFAFRLPFTSRSSDDSLYEEYPLEFVVHPPKWEEALQWNRERGERESKFNLALATEPREEDLVVE